MNTETLQNNCNTPTEEYTFTYTVDEIKSIYKKFNQRNYKRAIFIAIILAVALIFLTIQFEYHFVWGLLYGAILGMGYVFFLSFFKTRKIQMKSQCESEERVSQGIYDYKVFDNYFMISVYRNNEKVREQKIYFCEIEICFDLEKHIVFQVQNQLHIMKKEMLQSNSFFYTLPNKQIIK